MTSAATTSQGPLERLRAFLLPGGEAAARRVRAFHTVQRGRIRSGPGAAWKTFTADERVDATTTAFCWTASIGTNFLTSVQVTDAYEAGSGRLVLGKGPVTLKTLTGPDVDAGEIQRYLAYAASFPALLVNNGSLEFTEVDPQTLRVRDRADASLAHVDIEVADSGYPVASRALRGMTVGSRVVPTPWSARGQDYREIAGMLIPSRMDAAWLPGGGAFTYVEIELTAIDLVD